MSRLITISKNDKLFRSYITGSFSKTKRARPVSYLDPQLDSNDLTFDIVANKDIAKPSVAHLVFALLRLNWLSLSLPAVATYCVFLISKKISIQGFDLFLFVASLFFIHAFIFLINDYYDHVGGADRCGSELKEKPIAKAWVRAVDVKYLAIIMLILGVFFSLSLFIKLPLYFSFVAVAALSIGFLYSIKNGLKALGLGELSIFVSYGPLLALALSVVASEKVNSGILVMSIFYGSLATINLGIRHLENIMYDDLSGNRTIIQRLGFDRSKKYLALQLLVSAGLFVYSLHFIGLHWSKVIYGGTLFIGYNAYLVYQLKKVKSPLSSRLNDLRELGALAPIFAALVMISFMIIKL